MILTIMNINELQNLKNLISMSGNKHAVSCMYTLTGEFEAKI